MYEKIKKLISDKNNNLDNQTLMYFTNYFYVLVKDGLIPNGITLEDLIDNAIRYASKVEFYDENHRVYLENGPDTKGLRDPDTKTIYIRGNLEELAKYNYIKDAGVKTADDISVHQEKLAKMKRQLKGMDEKISLAFEKRKEIYGFYDFYESRMKSDYEILLEQAKVEMERIRLAEEKEKAEQEKEMRENVRGSSVCGAVR